jgi:hypothetical protein
VSCNAGTFESTCGVDSQEVSKNVPISARPIGFNLVSALNGLAIFSAA